MKTLMRTAAISLASVALVAGNATAATAAPGDGAGVSLALQPTATRSSSVIVPVTITPTTPGVTYSSLEATVVRDGVPVANNVFISTTGGFLYERAWGAGTVTLTNVIANGQDNRVARPNYFYDKPIAAAVAPTAVRYVVDYKSKIRVQKRGKKLTFRLTARYINSAGRPVGIRKATVQVKRGSKWKTIKRVNLKKNGTAKFKRSDKKKRSYRMVIATTGTYEGGQTVPSRKI